MPRGSFTVLAWPFVLLLIGLQPACLRSSLRGCLLDSGLDVLTRRAGVSGELAGGAEDGEGDRRDIGWIIIFQELCMPFRISEIAIKSPHEC